MKSLVNATFPYFIFSKKKPILASSKGNGVFLLNRPEKLMAPTDN
jgi:hypothetical protein